MSNSRCALIIANSTYSDATLSHLAAPVEDALDLAAVLGDPTIGGFKVETCVDENSYAIGAAIEGFLADRKGDDLILLYFSGHGTKDEEGDLYFAAKDTQFVNRQLRRSTAVNSAFVNEEMRRCRSRRQVLLLDCCYSGAFPRGGVVGKGNSGVDSHDRFDGKGRVVLTASDAMQLSFEGADVQGEIARSRFTRALVDGLRTGKADRDHDGLVSIDELYDHVFERLNDAMPRQRPMKIGFTEGKLLLAKNPFAKPESALLPTELRQAMTSEWVSTRLSAARELVRLLANPNKGLALAARQALTELLDDDSRQVAQVAAAAIGPQEPQRDSSERNPQPTPPPTTWAASMPDLPSNTVPMPPGVGPEAFSSKAGPARASAPAQPSDVSAKGSVKFSNWKALWLITWLFGSPIGAFGAAGLISTVTKVTNPYLAFPFLGTGMGVVQWLAIAIFFRPRISLLRSAIWVPWMAACGAIVGWVSQWTLISDALSGLAVSFALTLAFSLARMTTVPSKTRPGKINVWRIALLLAPCVLASVALGNLYRDWGVWSAAIAAIWILIVPAIELLSGIPAIKPVRQAPAAGFSSGTG